MSFVVAALQSPVCTLSYSFLLCTVLRVFALTFVYLHFIWLCESLLCCGASRPKLTPRDVEVRSLELLI